jgi:hypothetical protein
MGFHFHWVNPKFTVDVPVALMVAAAAKCSQVFGGFAAAAFIVQVVQFKAAPFTTILTAADRMFWCRTGASEYLPARFAGNRERANVAPCLLDLIAAAKYGRLMPASQRQYTMRAFLVTVYDPNLAANRSWTAVIPSHYVSVGSSDEER